MLFSTDKQTQDDLNLFGRHGSDAVYHLFHRCCTRGGAALLDELFRHPLADADAINRRSNAISSLAAGAAVFPFENTLLDAVETYLANTDERTCLTGRAAGSRLGNLIGADTEIQQLYRGIEALVKLLQAVRQWLAKNTNDALRIEQEAMKVLLAPAALQAVWELPVKPTQAQLALLDQLLRFQHRSNWQQLLRHLFLLDVYTAVAKVAKERNWSFAVALPRGQGGLELTDVYHPQLKKAVPNTLHMNAGGNLVFLTGANMAGKSTFMKSVCVAVYLAHMGFPVAASAMRFSVLDGMYTTINLPDNLGMGASHFYAEVMRVKKMAQELQGNKNLMIVFDELFRGTNVKDACEATITVVAGFAARAGSRFIISTHIMEAAETLQQQCSSIQFLYLPTHMQGTQPVYTYTATPGISADRHGMLIIQNEGVLDILRNGKKKLTKTQLQDELYNG